MRNSFFAGLLVLVPVAASLAILIGFFTWLTDFMLPHQLRTYLEESPYPVFLYRLVALCVALVVVTVVGWLMRLVVGRQVLLVMESLISRVPLLNKTYAFMKEISHTVLSGQKTMFQRVVLVEFPRAGIYSIGFVTSETGGEVQARTRETVLNVFVPTTPNPTSGYLIFVPKDKVIVMTMSVAEGMKLVISGGAVVPLYPPPVIPPVLAVDGDRAS
ncbi:MAG: hypothetical protein PCFJNLEI_01910 [Verrucomicrobiae bacterium]|nr:hypothetical protein [Verrucomicrobiae bacterium]